jgi:hypothetical protein
MEACVMVHGATTNKARANAREEWANITGKCVGTCFNDDVSKRNA